MNLYELSNRFWQENEYEPFSTSDIALYFYLLHRANNRRWQMPLRCPTAMICCHLKTTRQNIVKARESLRQRGLIAFTQGKGKDTPAFYTIVENPDTTLSAPLPDELPGQLSDKMTGELTHGLSDKTTVYKKDKEIDKDIIIAEIRSMKKSMRRSDWMNWSGTLWATVTGSSLCFPFCREMTNRRLDTISTSFFKPSKREDLIKGKREIAEITFITG